MSTATATSTAPLQQRSVRMSQCAIATVREQQQQAGAKMTCLQHGKAPSKGAAALQLCCCSHCRCCSRHRCLCCCLFTQQQTVDVAILRCSYPACACCCCCFITVYKPKRMIKNTNKQQHYKQVEEQKQRTA